MGSTIMLALSTLFLIVSWTSACSPVKNDKPWGLVKTLHKAPIVVIATDIYHSTSVEEGYVDPENNTAILTVDCVMKSGGYNISRNISIVEGAVRDQAACQVSSIKVGTTYILALEKYASLPEGKFAFYEPNVMTSGAYEASEGNLEAAATVCGMDNPVTALGVGTVQDLCPVVLVHPDACETGGVSWMTSSFALLTVSVIFGGWLA